MPSQRIEAKTVLVVEDDTSLRELLCRSLARQGFETVAAGDGEEAFGKFTDSLQNGKIDALVTDFAMPRMDGAALVRKIKKVRPEFPVVLVTGDAPDAVVLELACFTDCLTLIKPFRPEALREGLRRVLSYPMESGKQDRRQSFRTQVSVSCELALADGRAGTQDEIPGTIRNLSFKGCYVQTSESLRPGDRVRLSFQGLGQYPVSTECVWSEQKGAGLRVLPESAEVDVFFKKFVLNKLKQKGVGIMGAG